MKVFLDTNIFIEYFIKRKDKDSVAKILSAVEDEKISAFASLGSFYTMSYVLEQGFKRMEIHRPQLTKLLRISLQTVLELTNLSTLSPKCLSVAINDENFTDIEDAFQYHCAQENGCDVLITINTRDFKRADESKMKIMTPKEFVKNYNI